MWPFNFFFTLNYKMTFFFTSKHDVHLTVFYFKITLNLPLDLLLGLVFHCIEKDNFVLANIFTVFYCLSWHFTI